MRESLAKNAMYKLILNVFNLLVPLLVSPYIARILDPEYFGMYNRVYTEFQVFFTIAGFGIYNYGVREISRIRDDKDKVNKLFTNLFLIGVFANITITLFYILYFINRGNQLDLIVYSIMMIQFVGNVFYIEFINEAAENYGFIAKKTIFIRMLYFIAIFAFVRTSTDVIAYALVICLTVFVNNFVSYLYLKKSISFDFSEIKIMHHIIPCIVALTLANIEILYTTFDRLMLGWFYSPVQAINDVQVSRYTIPTTLMGMIATIPLSLISVSIPRMSVHLGANDREGYNNVLENTSNTYMSILIPMCFGVFVLAYEIIYLYSGENYIDTYRILMIAAGMRLICGAQSIISNLIMYVNGLEKSMVILLGAFGAFNVVENFALYFLGIMTPETLLLTTAFATLLYDIFAFNYSKKKLNIQLRFFSKRMIGYYCISTCFIPIALIVKAFHFHYLVNIVLIMPMCMLLYLAFLIKTKDPILDFFFAKFVGIKNKTIHK